VTTQDAVLVVLTVLVVLLTIGLAGCVRALRLIGERVEGRSGLPALQVGDAISVPSWLNPRPDSYTVLLFLSHDCGACIRASRAVQELVDGRGNFRGIELWKQTAGKHPDSNGHHDESTVQVVEHAYEAFQ